MKDRRRAIGSLAGRYRIAVAGLLVCLLSPGANAQGSRQAGEFTVAPAPVFTGQSPAGETPAIQEEGAANSQRKLPAFSPGPLAPASTLTIAATFDPSLTAAEIAVINSAISFYQATFTDPITVTIYFQDMSTGLGQSSTFFGSVSYQSFITALAANATSADDAAAFAGGRLPNSTTNPVNGSTIINLRTANFRALGFNVSPPAGQYDGVISLNTAITDVDGGIFSLLATVEHEIDEVLGLGSALPSISDPFPEDLFRYAGTANVRSFSANASCSAPPQAFFSIDGTAHLNELHNCTDGNDYGDWITHTPSQVQDAVTNGTGSPSLNVGASETRALDVIGYHIAAKHRRGQITSQ
jgi:hypothetical protein